MVAGGDINYSAFIQAIDEEYTAQVYETEQKMEGVSLHAKDGADGSGVGGGAEEGARPGQVDVDMMVERIREHVDVNRIRVRGRGGEGRGGDVVKVEARNAVCVCTLEWFVKVEARNAPPLPSPSVTGVRALPRL